MSVVTLYRIPQVIELTTGTGAKLMNYAVNRTDFTLFRYVDNEIDILVRNIDRKPVSFDDATAVMHIVEPLSQRLVLSKDLTIVDAEEGHLRLTITGEEASELPKKSLRFTVTMVRADTTTALLFTDRHRQPHGIIHVEEGPLPEPKEPVILGWDDFLKRNGYFYAGTYQGAALVHNHTGVHSVLVTLANFTGSVTVEGSYELSPDQSENEWKTLAEETFLTETGRVHIPFEGQIMWVRFRVQKKQGDLTELVYHN
jgi:hypothetical protein